MKVAAVAAGLVLATAGTASAGEYTGNGGVAQGATNAASECAYSGLDAADSIENNPLPELNDDGVAKRGNQSPGGTDRYHGVQNLGAIIKATGTAAAGAPGEACRGNAG